MKSSALLSAALATVILFACTGCGKPADTPKGLKDGTYTGEYESKGEHPSKMKVTLEIAGEKITKVEAVEVDDKGNPKDESYCKGAGEKIYAVAQKAVAGLRTYPDKLLQTQNLAEVDAVSGATTSHKAFVEAVHNALSKAR